MTPHVIEKEEVKVRMDNLIAAIKEAGTHYIFEPVSNKTIDSFRRAIEQTLQGFTIPERNLSGHIKVTRDPEKPDVVHFGPNDDAPQWVFDLFEQVSRLINENKEDTDS
jgi:methionine aminopeptidase